MCHWIDLLWRASHADGYNGLPRGGFRGSRRSLAKDWGISEKTARVFLQNLVKCGMLTLGAQSEAEKGPRKGQTRGQIYVVVNYDKYQSVDADWAQDEAQEKAHKVAEKGPPRSNYKKELKKDSPPTPSLFEDGQIDLEEAIAAKPDKKPKAKPRAKTEVKSQVVRQGIEAWDAVAAKAGAAPCKFVNKNLEAKVAARIDEVGGLEGWEEAMALVAGSAFLTGKVPGRNGKSPFRATLDWVAGPENFSKLMNGTYGRAKPKQQQNGQFPPGYLYQPYVLPVE